MSDQLYVLVHGHAPRYLCAAAKKRDLLYEYTAKIFIKIRHVFFSNEVLCNAEGSSSHNRNGASVIVRRYGHAIQSQRWLATAAIPV